MNNSLGEPFSRCGRKCREYLEVGKRLGDGGIFNPARQSDEDGLRCRVEDPNPSSHALNRVLKDVAEQKNEAPVEISGKIFSRCKAKYQRKERTEQFEKQKIQKNFSA